MTTNLPNEEDHVLEKVDPLSAVESGSLRCCLIANDRSRENLYYLTQLKIIFQRQLPKMPREYISRLIYDYRHESIVLLSTPGLVHPLKQEILSDRAVSSSDTGCKDTASAALLCSVVGGITIRRFGPEAPFLEIVFCAISSTDQVRGYGAYLMSILKTWVVRNHPNIRYFLTYADNYAVGYFKKQGFSKQITLDRSVWGGLIKDYDGGTLMECRLIPGITEYRYIKSLLSKQREALLELIKRKNPSPFIRYPGLESARFPVDPQLVPGLQDRTWSSSTVQLEQSVLLKDTLSSLLVDLQTHHSSWPFLEPVKIADVPDYLSIVKEPMDLKTIGIRIFTGHYQTLDQFISDVMLVFNNCRAYNQEHTPYYKCANVLELYFKERLKTL